MFRDWRGRLFVHMRNLGYGEDALDLVQRLDTIGAIPPDDKTLDEKLIYVLASFLDEQLRG